MLSSELETEQLSITKERPQQRFGGGLLCPQRARQVQESRDLVTTSVVSLGFHAYFAY